MLASSGDVFVNGTYKMISRLIMRPVAGPVGFASLAMLLSATADAALIYTFSGQIDRNFGTVSQATYLESIGRSVGQTVTFQLLLDFGERGYTTRYSIDTQSFSKSYIDDRIDSQSGYYQDVFLAEWAGGDAVRVNRTDNAFGEYYGIQWFRTGDLPFFEYAPALHVSALTILRLEKGLNTNIIDWAVGDSFSSFELWSDHIEGVSLPTGWADDNIVLTNIESFSEVPVPATFSLFALGLSALAIIGRRKRKQHT